jgi:hypothetical protein
VAQQFKQELDRIDASHDQRRCPAMVKGERVPFLYECNDTCRNGLLTDAKVHLP